MPKKILFVCLGNICRSPVAQGIAESMYPEIEFDSAGTGSWHTGEQPDKRSIEVCKKHNIDISHQRARPLRFTDPKEFDFIIGMDLQNIADIKKQIPEKYHYKVRMLDTSPITDPYYGGKDGFETMFQHIKKSIEKREIF